MYIMGFQWNVNGSNITGASGGAAEEAGYMVSAGGGRRSSTIGPLRDTRIVFVTGS